LDIAKSSLKKRKPSIGLLATVLPAPSSSAASPETPVSWRGLPGALELVGEAGSAGEPGGGVTIGEVPPLAATAATTAGTTVVAGMGPTSTSPSSPLLLRLRARHRLPVLLGVVGDTVCEVGAGGASAVT
jgi:hypothetical protein